MLSLESLKRVVITRQAIRDWEKIYRAVIRTPPNFDQLSAGLFVGELQGLGKLLIVSSMQYDERTRDADFRLGWQAAQLQQRAARDLFGRAGLFYFKPSIDWESLIPSQEEFARYRADVGELPYPPVRDRSTDELILTTTTPFAGPDPMVLRGFVLSLQPSGIREVAARADWPADRKRMQ